VTGLHLHRSDRTEHLVQVLTARLWDPAALPVGPMEPITFVMGSRGMERWLWHRLATELSVCA
jgi:exonuclease V gamma subunit